MAIVSAIAKFNSPLIPPCYYGEMFTTRIDRLKKAMQDAGLDQPALAAKIGCTQGAISQILLGNTQRSRYLPDIADALGVSLQWLRGEADDPNPHSKPVPTITEVADHFNLALVPELELGYSMGGGTLVEHVEQKGVVPFQLDWLRSMMSNKVADLFVARGEGDSMLPTILDGDFVLVDRAQRVISRQDRIWVLSYGGLSMIKRLRRLPNGEYSINSDNQTISPYPPASEEEIHVIGRVIWIGRRM